MNTVYRCIEFRLGFTEMLFVLSLEWNILNSFLKEKNDMKETVKEKNG